MEMQSILNITIGILFTLVFFWLSHIEKHLVKVSSKAEKEKGQ